MNRKIGILLSSICFILGLAGCSSSTSKAYTFSVETGDSIVLSLDTSDDYDITSELPFTITNQDDEESQGTFITADQYQQYADALKTDPDAVILDTGEKDGNEYIFWSYDNAEYNYAILIKDSNTGVLLGNLVSEEMANACFQRLVISKD